MALLQGKQCVPR